MFTLQANADSDSGCGTKIIPIVSTDGCNIVMATLSNSSTSVKNEYHVGHMS